MQRQCAERRAAAPGRRFLACVAAWFAIQIASASPAVAPDQPAPSPCRADGIRSEVLCGVVHVPLDADQPGGQRIDVHYIVVPALARRKQPDPVFLLAGGPGQSAIALAAPVLGQLDRLNNQRDIVFVDQRGTGSSSPLTCDDAASPADGFAEQADGERQYAAAMRCLAQLERPLRTHDAAGPGEALRHYTTPDAVRDLDAVRRALGASRIDLIGASYGTRVALEYLRQFPQHVRRSVLDGVAPPDMALPRSLSADNQAALDGLFDACAREPACARDHPALRTHWAALLGSLPMRIMVDDPLSGRPTTFTMQRDALLAAVQGPLYVPADAAALPAAIDAAAAGQWRGLVALSGLVRPRRQDALALGMHFSVVCSEDVPLLAAPPRAGVDRPPGADFGAAAAELYRRICADWPHGSLPAGYRSIPASASPVLLLSGGIDLATPPRHGARVAALLGDHARHVVVPQAGHGVLGLACVRDAVFRFIDQADDADALATDTACAAAVPRPLAYQPIDPAR